MKHSLADLLRRRIFQIACGYEDANDCNSLRSDPAFKISGGRLPCSGDDLASQPTLSRLENKVRRTELYRPARAFVDVFLASYERPPEAITLDIDDTDDPVHGGQQLSLFNGYYDEHCYMPLHIYEGQSGKLITTLLRPGRRPTGAQIVMILKRLVAYLRASWPEVRIILHGDGHFSTPEVHDFCEENDLYYLLGQTGNKRLHALGAALLERTRALARDREKPIRLFRAFSYQAATWKRPRRIIFKAEVSACGPNPRFVVTNLESSRPSFLYERVYCARGRMEGFIKNHKNALLSGRTSCHRFCANPFRLFLHSAAYVLLHQLSTCLPGTPRGRAQFDTLRKRLLKVGVRIRELATRIKLQFPGAFPLKDLYQRLCVTLC